MPSLLYNYRTSLPRYKLRTNFFSTLFRERDIKHPISEIQKNLLYFLESFPGVKSFLYFLYFL
ncbi:hypothetical protein DQM68_01900 [Leptospira mayottensis]|uniref:Uncharacterized protein n=2 Tax=Leptospira mayottensis TaxID=1137606 RepID=A0AA87SVG0_9LEPT|nr:hypothetical protein DQM68_01900 [Leptospira mayottensis]AZQ01027.1 hypothetical protein LEP1GSC190_02075 [Leptospira mayottensis 200901116]EKR99010.1 hypothetical protein LEP1GSC125_2843 [Leptospira mayottensis 200901122]AXR63436.1 hypothetical protein DQM28_03535 [Leptospira mayottensis]AXR67203.1 hypothetical protein DPV73_03450 [Leptospira mayottensis]